MANAWLKLCSLLVAIVLALLVNYFFVNADGSASVLQFIVPVEIKNLPPDKMIIWPPARQAEVTIQGPSLFLSRIAASPPIFRVQVPQDAKNRFMVQLKREALNLPPYVKVLHIKPAEIEFTLDTVISKQVPVIIPRIGTLPEQFKLDHITVAPEKVEVRGPENDVKPINVLETAPFDLRDITQSTEREMELRVPGSFTDVSQRRVMVSLGVSVVQSEAGFDGLPVEVRSLTGESVLVNPSQVAVRLVGPKEQVKALRRDEVVPYVRISRVPERSEPAKVAVDAPRWITILKVEPESVSVFRPQPTPKRTTAGVSRDKGRK